MSELINEVFPEIPGFSDFSACINTYPEKSLARELDGVEHYETIWNQSDLMKRAWDEGLVVVYADHDDLLVFNGAIRDETYVCDPWIVRVDREGLVPHWEDIVNYGEEECQKYFERKQKAKTIELIWHDGANGEECEYELRTDIPHEVFSIMEDGVKFSRGIVFHVSDLGEEESGENQYLQFANREFRAAGWCDDNGKFKCEMQEAICKHVEKLLDVFHGEGHSGSSAPYAIDLFSKLAKFEPIAPLTGEDCEWEEVAHYSGEKASTVKVFQNKRCSRVFKQTDRFDCQAYDIDGKVFWERKTRENGEEFKMYFTCSESRVPITFPYTPNTEYVEYEYEDQ